MPRRARLEMPGVPMHIVQRGVNRGAIFVDDEDRTHYLALHDAALRDHSVALYAYVLMGNHVHLLLGAMQTGSVSRALRWAGQCYVQAFNRRHRRTGTLWEGRFRSCLVATDAYLMRAMRYIELNPVRARMVVAAENYPWSSVHGHLGLRPDPLLTAHPVLVAWISGAADPAAAYRAFLREDIAPHELQELREHLRQERAWGDARFQAMVEKTLGRPARVRPPGRPRTADAD
jgi:putative transposase